MNAWLRIQPSFLPRPLPDAPAWPRPAPAPRRVSEQMIEASRLLAERVTGGEFAALSVQGRAQLRRLTLDMAAMADAVRLLEEAESDRRARAATRARRLRRWCRRLGLG